MAGRLDQEKALKWLSQYWSGTKMCPICGNNQWAVQERPWELREFQGGALAAGSVIPLVVVTCDVCGHTLLFNALKMSAVDKERQGQGPDD